MCCQNGGILIKTYATKLIWLAFIQRWSSDAAVICEQNSISYNSSRALSAVRGNNCPEGSSPVRIAAVNIFDSLWITSDGQSTSTDGRPTTYEDVLDELDTAVANGVRVFRFFASLFQSSGAFWQQNPDVYWQQFDQLMDDIAARELYVIPSVGYSYWNYVANTLHPGLNETFNDMVKNESSVSQQLALQYFDDLVRRYASHSSVLFWELGNELNNMVNLPPPWCDEKDQCFDTAAMVAYTDKLVTAIYAADADSNRPISSGFTVPRPSAWHMEHCPMQGDCPADPAGGTFWTTDTQAQWAEQLKVQQSSVDVWSVHYYNSSGGGARDAWGVHTHSTNSSSGECFFTDPCVDDMAVLTVADQAATQAGVSLFIGEFGGPNPEFTGPSADSQLFPEAVLQTTVDSAQSGGSILISAIWAWECYTHRSDMNCIFPGSDREEEAGSDTMIQVLKDTNRQLSAL